MTVISVEQKTKDISRRLETVKEISFFYLSLATMSWRMLATHILDEWTQT